MCDFITPLIAAGAGSATAAGATASAASTLATLGTIVSVGGTALTALQARRDAKDTSARIDAQRETERQLNAVEDRRSRSRFWSAIRQQSAQLLSRGVDLSSPTAVALGEEAMRELTFESQSIRSGGAARDAELSDSQVALQSRSRLAMLRGGFSAAGTVLNAAPDIWPELLA